MFVVSGGAAGGCSVHSLRPGEDKVVWERADTSGRLILWQLSAEEKHPGRRTEAGSELFSL